MAAAAFKVTLTASLGSPNGPRKTFPLTASDVADAALVFPSGGTEIALNMQDVWINDIVLSAAGTDTSQMEFFVGGVSTGQKTLNATNLGTTLVRTFQQAPLRVSGGQVLKIIQRT